MNIRKIDKITVFLNNDPVGYIRMDANMNRCVFEYASSWLEHGWSISPRELPLQTGLIYSEAGAFDGGFAVFEDSLPDGYGRYLLDRILRTEGLTYKELTPLQRYAIVGSSGFGALVYKPSFKEFEQIIYTKENELDSIQKKALDIFSEKTDENSNLLYYLSGNSGGARPKALYRDNDGNQWIIKFRHETDPASIGLMEYLYMSTALECGIQIPRIKIMADKYFAIERFDVHKGKRYHTLTAAALLRSDFRACNVDYTNLLALTGYLTQDPNQVEQMFRRMVFNVIVQNKDDHAKNFSFICNSGRWFLAPAYDLTYSPGGNRGEHATSVFWNGNPDKNTLIKAGVKIKMDPSLCEDIIAEIQYVCNKNLKHTIQITEPKESSQSKGRLA